MKTIHNARLRETSRREIERIATRKVENGSHELTLLVNWKVIEDLRLLVLLNHMTECAGCKSCGADRIRGMSRTI